MENAKLENSNLVLCKDAYEACGDTSVIVIGTEWNEFRALNFFKIKNNRENLYIFDLRNIYNPEELKDLGYKYFGTGK